jgi:hypothetical protein
MIARMIIEPDGRTDRAEERRTSALLPWSIQS